MKFEVNKEFVLFAVSFAILISILIYYPYELRLIGEKILEVVEQNNQIAEQNSQELENMVNNTMTHLNDTVANLSSLPLSH